MIGMMAVLVIGVAAGAAALAFVRPQLRRWRWRRQLVDVQRDVADAMRDGRIAEAPGEAILQHLDGLWRACSKNREEP